MDQLVRERPGCLLRSSDPEAELRYLVEALRSERTGETLTHRSTRNRRNNSEDLQVKTRKDFLGKLFFFYGF